jgi:hypothetical protein
MTVATLIVLLHNQHGSLARRYADMQFDPVPVMSPEFQHDLFLTSSMRNRKLRFRSGSRSAPPPHGSALRRPGMSRTELSSKERNEGPPSDQQEIQHSLGGCIFEAWTRF